MVKVSLDLESFKALASETRLDILRTLDGKKMSLNDISKATNLHKMTLHEHLSKLTNAGFIKKIEREGHKWVYYKLSWKGESLLHPDNTRIAVMFSMTFISLLFGIYSFVNYIGQKLVTPPPNLLMAPPPDSLSEDSFFLYLTVVCILVFSILLSFSIWRYKKNLIQKL